LVKHKLARPKKKSGILFAATEWVWGLGFLRWRLDQSGWHRLRYSTTIPKHANTLLLPVSSIFRFSFLLLFNFIFLQIQLNSYTIPHQQQSQASLSERALELLALPEDGVPKLLLDIGTLYFNSFISLFLYTLCNVWIIYFLFRLWIWTQWWDTLRRGSSMDRSRHFTINA
jgi:hypothetical protein